MKFSKAMLNGFEKVGGKHYRQREAEPGYGAYFPPGDDPMNPSSVCATGAANLGFGRAANDDGDYEGDSFEQFWGVCVSELSDEGMPWEHIYGMARAVGL